MKFNLPRIRDLSFWHYQIAGWLTFAILQLAIAIAIKGWNAQVILSISLQVFAGFLLTSLLRLYYRRIPHQDKSLLYTVVLITICSFAITVIWYGVFLCIEYSLFGIKSFNYISKPLQIFLIIAHTFPDKLGWSALYFGIKFWRDWLTERELTEHSTEIAQQAQFQMLRYQLNPHFLFNALNSIRALIDENAQSAKVMITELSEFLRYSLISRNRPIVTLKDEIDAIRLYLSIEQKRYEDKLQIDFDINKLTEDIPVPSFLIQPMVERALRCGMQTSSLPLKLKICTEFTDGKLKIAVIHSGDEIPSDRKITEALNNVGIEQIETRLQNLFPDRYHLYTTHESGSTQLILELTMNDIHHEEKVTGNHR